MPPRRIFEAIVKHLEHYKEKIQMKHLQRLWLDISTLCFTNFSLKLRVLSLVEMDALPADSPFKTFFMDASWACWNEIQVGLFIILSDKKIHVIKINNLLLTDRDRNKIRNIYST